MFGDDESQNVQELAQLYSLTTEVKVFMDKLSFQIPEILLGF
jgi:hypothetical protein